MKRKTSVLLSSVTSAVAAVLCGGTAAAADDLDTNPSKEDLTRRQSTIEVGAGGVSHDSFKFGEYNGLEKQGPFGIADFNLSGGGAYDSQDLTRWHIQGSDLALSDRRVAADYGLQGLFRLNFNFDEIRHNISDTYSTPYLGAGSNVLTLPSTWLIPLVPRVSATAANARGLSSAVTASSALVNGVLLAPTAAQLATANTIQAADLPAFHRFDLYTTRYKYGTGISLLATPKWEFSINAQRENRTGAKPMGTITATTGGDISTTIPDPIDQHTDQITASLGRRSRSDFVQFLYTGSIFHNDINSVTWTNWAQPTATMAMSSAPSNQMHQLLGTFGHTFSGTTRLVANGSYSRSTQDAAFLTNVSTPLVPLTSLRGVVVDKAFNLKLTSRPTSKLVLDAGYKYDERKNETPVNPYGFYDANTTPAATNINSAFATALGVPPTLLGSNVNINENRPYSRRLNQVDAAADYKITPTEAIKASYQFENLRRWCDGDWFQCADALGTKESTGSLEWRANPWESLNARLSYNYSNRTTDGYTENAFLALVPMANVSPTGALGGASAYSYMLANGWTGYGPVAGYAPTTGNMNLFFPLNNALANATYQNQNRISELIGMLRYYEAPRKRNRARANLDWQPFERLGLQGSVDYRDDNYYDTTYGLYRSRDLAASFDGTLNATENLEFTLFYTYEMQRSRSAGNSYTANSAATSVNGFTAISGGCFATIAQRNANNKIDPCLNWYTEMQDKTHVMGLTADRKNLFREKLDLSGQVIVTRASTDYGVTGGNYVNNPLAVTGAPAGTIAAYFIPTAPLPTVIDNSIQFRLSAKYALNKFSALRLTYLYAQLTANDYAYQGYQLGGLAAILPTGQTAPEYHVHVFGLSYAATF
jgi:hypothetical protein